MQSLHKGFQKSIFMAPTLRKAVFSGNNVKTLNFKIVSFKNNCQFQHHTWFDKAIKLCDFPALGFNSYTMTFGDH